LFYVTYDIKILCKEITLLWFWVLCMILDRGKFCEQKRFLRFLNFGSNDISLYHVLRKWT